MPLSQVPQHMVKSGGGSGQNRRKAVSGTTLLSPLSRPASAGLSRARTSGPALPQEVNAAVLARKRPVRCPMGAGFMLPRVGAQLLPHALHRFFMTQPKMRKRKKLRATPFIPIRAQDDIQRPWRVMTGR